MTDKIDTLVGFFGLNLKPSSSKDPYALRRLAFGLVKIIIENKNNLKLQILSITLVSYIMINRLNLIIKKFKKNYQNF